MDIMMPIKTGIEALKEIALWEYDACHYVDMAEVDDRVTGLTLGRRLLDQADFFQGTFLARLRSLECRVSETLLPKF